MIAVLQKKYMQFYAFILKITKMKYFNEIYAGFLALITILGWKFSSEAGMIGMILLAIFALLATKDLKFAIPNCIYFVFMYNKGFANDELPITILVFGSLFVLTILVFSFRGGIHLKKLRSLLGLSGLALSSLLPIFWCAVPSGNEVFYFLFFGNFMFLLIYIIMANGIKENGIQLLAVSMSYLAVILACECVFKAYELRDTCDNILDLWYYLGWGLCNEAGIMICVSIPFSFYLLGKQEKIIGMFFQNLKILIGAAGILLTTSRGGYLFGVLEIGILYVILMFTAKRTRLYQNLFLGYSLTLVLIVLLMKPYFIQFIDDVLNLIFTNGFDDNGRKEIWMKGIELWDKSSLTRLFGPGFVCSLYELPTADGVQLSPQVFHSTFVETLASGGILAFSFLLIHFYQKYKNIKKCDTFLFLTVGVGLVIIDCYGLIDNTYHMFYFMIPLMVIMATIDSSLEENPQNGFLEIPVL